MSININNKKLIISKIIKKINTIQVIIVAKYKGINVSELTNLRIESKKNNIYLSVLKNNLVIKAIKNTKFKHLTSYLHGQLIYFFNNDIIKVSKVINNFLKINTNLKVKIGSYDNKNIFLPDIIYFSKIPSFKILIIKLLNLFKYSIINFIKIILMLIKIKNKNK